MWCFIGEMLNDYLNKLSIYFFNLDGAQQSLIGRGRVLQALAREIVKDEE